MSSIKNEARQSSQHRVSCIFVHGWAMNSAVWQQCQNLLPDWIDAIFIDLPGHGSMSDVSAQNLDDYVQILAPLVHKPVIWVGWSLGAQAVMRLADLYPEKAAGLFLVAATPCFVTRHDWTAAVDEKVFTQFAQALAADQEKTLMRFLSLQVKGLAQARQTVRQLQQAIHERGQASSEALSCGLEMLVENDFRDLLTLLKCPVSWFLGERDTLVPVAVADEIRARYSHHKVLVAPQAGHTPFLSQQDLFVDALVAQARLLRSGPPGSH